ncbi:MAG: sulfatase [Planctomycetota bacterium]|nr:sulfatase [Planctomycetota bacterium]
MLTRRAVLQGLGAGALGLGAGALRAMAGAPAGPKLNFVFFLIDDMGWMDLACQGSRFYETPHIDRLAAQGMRFTNAYAACPVCSPTRASIMTGKYPARLHVTDWIAGHVRPFAKLRIPDWTKYLPLEEVTIAEALKPAGYATASIGKWHLGGEAYWPDKQGFDLNFAGTHQGQPPSYFAPYKIQTIPSAPDGEYLTDRLAEEACKFIEKSKDRPFFVYLPHYAVHSPLMAKKETIEKYKAKAKPEDAQRNTTYAAMIQSVDDSVGQVCAKLEALGLADRTVVLFMSDNGGVAGTTSNAPLRAGKGTLYEGGIREPMIVRWPGVVKAGATCDEVVTSVDFFPTLLEMAGARAEGAANIDGVSIVPLLKQAGRLSREAVYWHYPHYHNTLPGGAVRAGDWKLIEYFEDGRVELYNLKQDLSETKDLAAAMPEKAADLRKKLADWRTRVGAQMPTPNPDYDPAKGKAAPKPKADKKKTAAQPGAGELRLADSELRMEE